MRRVFAVRKTKARSASARRQVRKAKISTTAPKAFTATAMCTSVIGRSLPEPSSQDNGSKAGSPSNVGRHVSQASHLGMSPCRKFPPATQRRSWPFVPSKDCQRDYGPQTGFPQPQQLLGARSCARCQPMQCRGLQPAAITVGPKSVTAAITLALRRLTGDHRPHAS